MSSIVKVDTIQENTSANGITVDGLNIKDSKLVTANSVVQTNITDGIINNAKTNFVSTSSAAGLQIKGDGSSQDGYIQLNCSQNSHGIKLKSPAHSAGASYTLTFPVNDGDANQVLTTNGSGVLSFTTPASAANTPAFQATLAGAQTVSDATTTKLTFTSETFDSDGTFASSRFTPAVAGTYFVYFKALTDPSAYANERDSNTFFYKNGSNVGGFPTNFMTGGNTSANGSTAVSHTNHGIFVLDDNDYIEVYGNINTWSSSNATFTQKVFGGYRIII